MIKMLLYVFSISIALLLSGCSNGARGYEALKLISQSKERPIIRMDTSEGSITIELWNDIAPKTVENFTQLAFGGKEWTNPRTGNKETGAFYDGLTFHRVSRDFIIQGGCPIGNGNGGPGYYFNDEIYDDTNAEVITGFITTKERADQLYRNVIKPYLNKTTSPDKEILLIMNQCRKSKSMRPLMKHPVEYYLKKTGRKEPLRDKGILRAKVEYGTICMANTGPDTNGSQFFIVTKKEGCEWLNGKHTVFGKVIKGKSVINKIQMSETTMGYKPIDDIIIKKVVLVPQKKKDK